MINCYMLIVYKCHCSDTTFNTLKYNPPDLQRLARGVLLISKAITIGHLHKVLKVWHQEQPKQDQRIM